MSADPLPETLRLREPSPQGLLPLATDGVARHVWEGRFGAMLIEVRGEEIWVNGERVEPAASPRPPAP